MRAKWSKEGCGQIQRVHAIKRDETLKPSETTTNLLSRVPLVIADNPALRIISSIIQRHFKILSSSPRCSSVFQTAPLKLVAFRRTDNLSDILVRSKLRTENKLRPPRDLFDAAKIALLIDRQWFKLYVLCRWGNKNHS